MRTNGVVVNGVPMHLSADGKSTHSLYFPTEDVCLPLDIHGCISHLSTRIPYHHDIKNCTWLELTSSMEWDPCTSEFKQQEDQARDDEAGIDIAERQIFGVLSSISDVLEEECAHKVLFAEPKRVVGAIASSD